MADERSARRPQQSDNSIDDSADAALRGELARDGWRAGHEEYRTEESQRLHGGEKAGPEGRQYLKDGIVFSINRPSFGLLTS